MIGTVMLGIIVTISLKLDFKVRIKVIRARLKMKKTCGSRVHYHQEIIQNI